MTTPATVAEVKLVIPTGALTDEQIQVFIDDAVLLVDRCSSVAATPEATQRAIVKYVAAHFMSLRYGQSGVLVSESIGDASKSYAQPARNASPGVGLNASWYGQQAVLLDPTGCIERLGKMKPTFEML